MLLYATLLLCSIAIGAQVYRYDLYDREPPHAILLAMVGGAIGLYLAGLAQVAFITWMGAAVGADFNLWLAFAAGTTEELAKISVVALIALARPRWFNDPLDGAIYGAFAGLGAAVYESVMHLGWPADEPFLPATEPIRLMGHLVMGGIGGFGVGFVKVHGPPRQGTLETGKPAGAAGPERAKGSAGGPGWAGGLGNWWWLTGCLLGAMVLHFAWDVIAFDAADKGRMLPWHTAGSVLLMLSGMVAFRLLVRKGAERSRG